MMTLALIKSGKALSPPIEVIFYGAKEPTTFLFIDHSRDAADVIRFRK